MSETTVNHSFVVADPFVTLFLSFLTYLLVILGGVYIVWLFPVVKNGSTSPSPDVFIRWSTAAASFLHSTVMTNVGVLVVFFENWQSKSVFDGQSPLVPIFVAWEVGHQLQQAMFKCYLMIESNRSQGLIPLMQHALMISWLPWYDRLGVGDFFIGLFFLSHFSSAFWTLRMLLAKAGKEQTNIYQFVSIMCPLSFVLCRFLPVGFVLRDLASCYGWMDQFPTMHVILLVCVTVYNLVAFIRMLQLKSIRKRLKLS